MHLGIAGLLAFLLGLVLALGNCSGVDTSSIEELGDSLGIEPMEISFDGSGLNMGGTESEDDFFSWDEMDFEMEWTVAETAEECAEGAGVGTFPDCTTIDIWYGDPSVYYYYKENHAQALCIYEGIFASVDKAVYEGIDDVSDDDRDFDLEWTETIDGVEVQCFGYEDGIVCKALFNDGEYAYSVYTMGPDDNINLGLTVEELGQFVSALL